MLYLRKILGPGSSQATVGSDKVWVENIVFPAVIVNSITVLFIKEARDG